MIRPRLEGVSNLRLGAGSVTGDRPGPRSDADVRAGPLRTRTSPSRPMLRDTPGSIAELPCGAVGAGAILSGPSAPGTLAEHSEPRTTLEERARHPVRRTSSRRSRPRLRSSRRTGRRHHPRSSSYRRISSNDGREAGLARRPRRTPGHPLTGELRDVAARHRARRRRRPAVPDRRPERLRQGLARVPLPLPDQPDARPDRRLQRPGGLRRRDHPGGRGGGGAGRRADRRRGAGRPQRQRPPRSGSSPAGSGARAGPPTSTRATRSATSSSARPTAWPTPPACRSRSARATPTTRSSCTAASASARPT